MRYNNTILYIFHNVFIQYRNQTVDKCSAPFARPNRQNIKKTVSPRVGQRETESIELNHSHHNPTKDFQEKSTETNTILKSSTGSKAETCEYHIYKMYLTPHVDFQQPAKVQEETALFPLYLLPISKTTADANDDDGYLVPERKDEESLQKIKEHHIYNIPDAYVLYH